MKTITWAMMGTLLATPALSQQDVARANAVTTRVSAEISGRTRTIATGATLIQDEWVRTNGTGRADLTFLDGTQLAVGPGSSVKLDEYVYSPGRGGARFVLNATKGLFRFSTGALPKGAYQIRTPVGVLGVRGTVFTFRVEPTRVVVSVFEGSVTACPSTGGPSRCSEAGPGQSLLTTPREVTRRATGSLPRNLAPRLQAPALPGLQRAGAPGRGLDATPNTGLPLPRASQQNTDGGLAPGLGRTAPGLNASPSGPGGVPGLNAAPGLNLAPGLGGGPLGGGPLGR
jgi:hypothetical protein